MEWCEHLPKDGELGLLLEAQPWKYGLRLCGSADGDEVVDNCGRLVFNQCNMVCEQISG
jgi:hypothetical protein